MRMGRYAFYAVLTLYFSYIILAVDARARARRGAVVSHDTPKSDPVRSQICWSEYQQTHGDGFAHATRRDERVPRARRAPAEHALEVRPVSLDTEPL